MTVAILWVVGVGGKAEAEEEAQNPISCVPKTSEKAELVKGMEKPPRGQEESCFLRGRLLIVVALVQAELLPLGQFVPQVWPTKVSPVLKASTAWAKCKRAKQQKRKEKLRRKGRKRDQRRRQKPTREK